MDEFNQKVKKLSDEVALYLSLKEACNREIIKAKDKEIAQLTSELTALKGEEKKLLDEKNAILTTENKKLLEELKYLRMIDQQTKILTILNTPLRG